MPCPNTIGSSSAHTYIGKMEILLFGRNFPTLRMGKEYNKNFYKLSSIKANFEPPTTHPLITKIVTSYLREKTSLIRPMNDTEIP